MKRGVLSLYLGQSTLTALVFFGLFVAGSARGTIIPSDRIYPWNGNVGVPGGIPNRTMIFANVKNAPYSAKGDGVTDDSTAIQAALNACPSNQVVYIPTGTYYITTALQLKNGYTVRGDGPGLTIIDWHGGSGEVIGLGGMGGQQDQYRYGAIATANVTSGTGLGSSTITVDNASGISVGNMLNIDVLNDTNGVIGVSPIGNNGYQNVSARDPNATRSLGQVVLVTNVSGTTISFDPPLCWYFTNVPQATSFVRRNSMAGVENLTVNNNNTGADFNFSMNSVTYCWLKNIESEWADGDHAVVDGSARCEVRDSYFHDAYLHGPGTHDSTLRLNAHSSGLLVENNIFRRMHIAIMPNGGGGNGSVIAYNFMTNNFDASGPQNLECDVEYHGAHVLMTLYEGNVLNAFSQDGVWGTSSHGTLLRNYITAQNWVDGPYTGRGPEDGVYLKQYSAARAIALAGMGKSKYFNVVGNLIGTATMGNYPTYNPIFMMNWPSVREWDHEGYVWTLGYSYGSDAGNQGGSGFPWNQDNTDPFTTLINHGNWDIVNNSQTWSNNISDHVIPQSYYLASKPVFFGNLTWPPMDPTKSPPAIAIPAQYRYFYGTNPPAGVINQPPVALASAVPTNGPAPLAVSFSSSGSYDPEGVALSYAWTFGDGTTSTAANPSHTYQNQGSYRAQLSVSDGTSTTTSSLITINITIAGTNQPPVAVASATPTAGPAPLLVSFSSAGSYDPEGATLSYNWTFGDGSTSTAANPNHAYAAGTFSAQLSVSDGTNTTSSSPMTISVTNPAPTVFLNSPTNGASYAAPATINLAASVTPNGHTITKVQFYNGTALLAEDTAAPYALSLTNMGPGTYSLVAQAVYDASATTASPAVTIGVGGLVAAYGFDEGAGATTADASGMGNNGTVSNATWTSSGRYGDALVFGTNALVTVNDSASLDLTNGITLEAWVYPTAVGGWMPVIFKPLGSSGLCYVLQGSSGGYGSTPSFGLSVSPVNLTAPSPLPLNTWSHLAATYDGVTMRLYINGTDVANQAQTGVVVTSSDPLTIGGDSSGENFAGSIDEVRIYSRSLSASQIQNDMNTPVDTPPQPPTGLHVVGGG